METEKTYEINSWADLLNVVTNENLPRLMPDLANFLSLYIGSVESIRTLHPALNDLKNTQIIEAGFAWTDDNKVGATAVTLTDSATGEVATITPSSHEPTN